MSIQAIAWVLEHSDSEGYDRLVLLAIANHCDARGWNAWPSAEHIARESRVHRATVFSAIGRLKDLGELEVTLSGGGKGQTNHYRLPLMPDPKPSPVATVTAPTKPSPRTTVTGSIPSPNRRPRTTQTVVTVLKDKPPLPPLTPDPTTWKPKPDDPIDPDEKARIREAMREVRRSRRTQSDGDG